MHLPPDGLVGRHVASGQQLFAVVTGQGWVSGDDPERRAIGPGDAALWEPGEEHEASSEEGLTAVCIEGEFDVWAMSVTRGIVVSDYDPAWPGWFDTMRAHLWPVVEDVALRIDHVGSTAVPGLAAKPIVDLDIVVKRRNAQLADRDMDVYVAAKAALMAELLARARAERGLPPASYWEPTVDLP